MLPRAAAILRRHPKIVGAQFLCEHQPQPQQRDFAVSRFFAWHFVPLRLFRTLAFEINGWGVEDFASDRKPRRIAQYPKIVTHPKIVAAGAGAEFGDFAVDLGF